MSENVPINVEEEGEDTEEVEVVNHWCSYHPAACAGCGAPGTLSGWHAEAKANPDADRHVQGKALAAPCKHQL